MAATANFQPPVTGRKGGRHALSNPQGGNVTLILQHGADGQVTGSLSGNGVQYEVEGMVEEGTAMGAVTNADGRVR